MDAKKKTNIIVCAGDVGTLFVRWRKHYHAYGMYVCAQKSSITFKALPIGRFYEF